METVDNNDGAGVVLAGGQRLAGALQDLGILGDASTSGLVYDASQSDPQDWPALEAELAEVFERTQAAWLAGAPIVYVVHEPSIWGHDTPLRGALATALLGGMRSAAFEGARNGQAANVVAVGDDGELANVADSIAFLLKGSLSGQTVTCGTTHLGRPAA